MTPSKRTLSIPRHHGCGDAMRPNDDTALNAPHKHEAVIKPSDGFGANAAVLDDGCDPEDVDRDGVLAEDDCDDNDAASTTKATDADCDGLVTDADCDDTDPQAPSVDTDPECDGLFGGQRHHHSLSGGQSRQNGLVNGRTYTRRTRTFLMDIAQSREDYVLFAPPALPICAKCCTTPHSTTTSEGGTPTTSPT